MTTSGEHPAIARFRDAHTLRGGTGRIISLPDSVHTAALAADGEPVLILTSGDHRVDTGKVAATLGVERLRRAAPDFDRTHTGQAIGGVSPLGHPTPVRTYVDTWLRRYAEIWAAAGHPAA